MPMQHQHAPLRFTCYLARPMRPAKRGAEDDVQIVHSRTGHLLHLKSTRGVWFQPVCAFQIWTTGVSIWTAHGFQALALLQVHQLRAPMLFKTADV